MAVRCPASFTKFAISLFAIMVSASPLMAQGFVLPAVGPVNRSMGGAATAAPLDATSAIHWNPATISGLERSEMDFGVDVLYPRTELSSAIGPSAFGPGVPPIPLAGSTEADNGAFMLPAFGLVYKPDDSCWTYGVGLLVVGGFGINYPGDLGNPILSPQPPNGLGVGPLFSRLLVMQFSPTASYQLTENLSIGFAPTVTMAELMVDPALFAAPDDANGDGFATYPAATHSRLHWGIGCQAGIYYTTDTCWHFGASIKSPQWFEKFRWHSADELGRPRTLKFDIDYPMIVSLGVAYSGFDRLLVAADLRYVDFENTDGLRAAGFDATGAVTGLGWDSVFFVAVGIQYQWSESLSLRLGYSYNPNPIPDELTAFNVAAPTIYEHVFAVGASYQLTDALKASIAYVHAFENSASGPLLSPFGPVPGTSVTNELTADALVIGMTAQF